LFLHKKPTSVVLIFLPYIVITRASLKVEFFSVGWLLVFQCFALHCESRQ